MGTPHAAVVSLERLVNSGHEVVAVYSQPDRPAGRGNKIVYSPVKQFAVDNGIPVFQPVKIKTDEANETFRSHCADVAVVVAYGRILPETYLNAFPKGAINVHFSLLPKYRGAAPVNWAIVNGEAETGVTTISMDAGLDTGDILTQRSTPIGTSENAVELMTRLATLGAEVLIETLETLDEVVPLRQDHENATYAPIMRKEDGRIDWSMSAEEIGNRVRGFQPFPTAFTMFRGHRLTIWQAEAAESDMELRPGEKGAVVLAHGDDLTVQCGDATFLRIAEVQPEGKRRMAIRDFNNGVRPVVGEILRK